MENELGHCFSNNLYERIYFLNFQIVLNSEFYKYYKNDSHKNKTSLKKGTNTSKIQDQLCYQQDSDVKLLYQIFSLKDHNFNNPMSSGSGAKLND